MIHTRPFAAGASLLYIRAMHLDENTEATGCRAALQWPGRTLELNPV